MQLPSVPLIKTLAVHPYFPFDIILTFWISFGLILLPEIEQEGKAEMK